LKGWQLNDSCLATFRDLLCHIYRSGVKHGKYLVARQRYESSNLATSFRVLFHFEPNKKIVIEIVWIPCSLSSVTGSPQWSSSRRVVLSFFVCDLWRLLQCWRLKFVNHKRLENFRVCFVYCSPLTLSANEWVTRTERQI
jgi:hypothetical protein